mgnify:CR=1 FL=1
MTKYYFEYLTAEERREALKTLEVGFRTLGRSIDSLCDQLEDLYDEDAEYSDLSVVQDHVEAEATDLEKNIAVLLTERTSQMARLELVGTGDTGTDWDSTIAALLGAL